MRINYNTSAVISNKALNHNDSLLSRSLQRLSTGLKINEAKDNPAGMAIANRMDSQVRGFKQAGMSTQDGISVVQTADGALSEVHSILQRLNQLAVQASTDTTLDADRETLDKEAQQLMEEIKRIAKDTEFNGQPLLDGTWDLKGYTNNANCKVNYYTSDVPVGEYKFEYDLTSNTAKLTDKNGNLVTDQFEVNDKGDLITMKGAGDFVLQMTIDPTDLADTVNVDITGMGPMKIQTGVNEGQELAIQIPTVSLRNMGLEWMGMSASSSTTEMIRMDIKTFDSAQDAITRVKSGIDYISNIRAKLGAYQNRLEHNSDSVDVSNENLTASYSRIMDVDMAEEMTEYTTRQVLVQAGVSMLSQANDRPQHVLQILQ
jgi:flagellin